ncbi:proton-coupled amino acid transporter-like protein pathetic [Megachile rotundata]|uniref:proton-coupled amino acid transporter-like protein pathetic n=1 Tax=Megachile rotundata TaxID=143995 RepID=UPI000614E54B|nr:PREDICTED: proton-coupled amino acid transporter 2-like [Megachile rotundata]
MKHADDPNPDDGDGYDPFANRPPGPLTSDFAALMHLLKAAIGTGVLFMPNAFRRNGFVMSIICSLCMGFLIIHTVVTLVRSAQLLCRRYRIPKLDFANTVEMSFRSGPEKMRKYGRHFGIFSNVIVCFVQIQAAVIYILYVSTSFQQVIEYYSGVSLDVRVYILAVFPIFLSFGFVPNLKYLAPISIIGTIFIFTGICVTLHYLLTDFPDPARLKMFTSVATVPLYCTLFMFAMHNVTLCMPLENSMKNPGHLPRLIVYNMLFTMCLNTTFGFLGYNKYMDKTCDTVIKNLPMDHPLAQFIKITISLSVICTFGIGFYVTFSILWPMLQMRYEEYKYASHLFRLIAVSLFFLVAISVPQMVPLLGLLTAFSITTIMLLIPILTETMTKWQTASRFLLAKNAGISIVWITLLIFGAIESMRTIIREYGSVKEEGC